MTQRRRLEDLGTEFRRLVEGFNPEHEAIADIDGKIEELQSQIADLNLQIERLQAAKAELAQTFQPGNMDLAKAQLTLWRKMFNDEQIHEILVFSGVSISVEDLKSQDEGGTPPTPAPPAEDTNPPVPAAAPVVKKARKPRADKGIKKGAAAPAPAPAKPVTKKAAPTKAPGIPTKAEAESLVGKHVQITIKSKYHGRRGVVRSFSPVKKDGLVVNYILTIKIIKDGDKAPALTTLSLLRRNQTWKTVA